MAGVKEAQIEKQIQKQKNIPLILNSYEEIFSNFDPRPFGKRALSDDFIMECKRAARDKEEGLELIMSLPKKLRNLKNESEIRKRLREHFKKHAAEKEKEIKKIRREGWTWVFIGSILMLVIAAIVFWEGRLSHLLVALSVLLEAPAWFSFWEGLDKIFITAKEKTPDNEFYQKMTSATITFKSY